MSVSPIPKGFHTVTPYLVVSDVAKMVAFVKAAFGAETTESVPGPDGVVRHAKVRIGDSMVMMGQAFGETKASPATIYLYVPDSDAVYAKAVAAGGIPIMPPATQFYGDRSGAVKDPCGNGWWIATHVEDVAPDELARRAAQAYATKK